MLSERNRDLLARIVPLERVTTVGGGLKLQSWMMLDEIMNIARAEGIMMAQEVATHPTNTGEEDTGHG